MSAYKKCDFKQPILGIDGNPVRMAATFDVNTVSNLMGIFTRKLSPGAQREVVDALNDEVKVLTLREVVVAALIGAYEGEKQDAFVGIAMQRGYDQEKKFTLEALRALVDFYKASTGKRLESSS